VKKDGWYVLPGSGSSQQFKHPVKPGRVTIPGHPGDDIALGTLHNILKQAGLK
jgi:predicted RNA binding protein YcfA (HicA-like mRNA interferase family)